MTKRAFTKGELITKTILDTFLTDLKGEALHGKIATKTGDYDLALDTDAAIVVADGTSATVEITLPAATGTGRVIIMVAANVDNAITCIRAGSDVINAAGVTITFTPVWEYACVVDIAAGQWAMLFGDAALT